jgi:hypothetical protein
MSSFYFPPNFSETQMKRGSPIKKQNRLLAELKMWNEFKPVTFKRACVNMNGFTNTAEHKLSKI